MIFHLKRFKRVKGEEKKLTQQIWFDGTINMDEMCSDVSPAVKGSLGIGQGKMKNIKYKLYAVIIHVGSIDAGHYYTYCKNGNDWYELNDEKVSVITTE